MQHIQIGDYMAESISLDDGFTESFNNQSYYYAPVGGD